MIASFGFDDVSIGLSGVFVALIGSPHRGAAQSGRARHRGRGIVFVLTVAYGVPLPEATAIALLDRVISVFSIILFGSIAHAISGKPRGKGARRQNSRPPGLDGSGPHPPQRTSRRRSHGHDERG